LFREASENMEERGNTEKERENRPPRMRRSARWMQRFEGEEVGVRRLKVEESFRENLREAEGCS